jgi:hypothetical protein
VPPRSPKRPLDPTGAFATAASLEDGFIGRGSAGDPIFSCCLFSQVSPRFGFFLRFCSRDARVFSWVSLLHTLIL